MARLIIVGPEGRTEVSLQAHNTLGRHPNNSIQLLDRIVSKEHMTITLVGSQYVLRDLGSLNGTYVDGNRISERALLGGEEIALGGTVITFVPGPPSAYEGQPTAPTPLAVPRQPLAGSPTTPAGIGSSRAGHPFSPFSAEKPGGITGPSRKTNVTMLPGMVESHIRSKLSATSDMNFLPERAISDADQIRRDYEKLRVSYELARAIGVELDIDKLLAKILDTAFLLLAADRGVVLLVDEDKQLKPRCVRTKHGADEEVVLSTTILETVKREKSAVLSNDASADSRFSGAHSIIMQGIRSTMAVPLLHGSELFGIMVLDSQVAVNAFNEKDLQLFQNVANQAAISIQNGLYAAKLEKEAVTRERFQRLLSPAIAEQVIHGKVDIVKGGELRDTTVLFTDIRGFTSMSESAKPEEIVAMLNEYFELMVEIIFRHEGTLDKFVGDEIMALFGAPVSHDNDSLRAVTTALEMLASLREFNSRRVAQGKVPIHIGIGINAGEVVAGYLGSSRALEYTVIGDVVNTGARLCSYAQAGQVIISETVYERVKHVFEIDELPPAQVKGKALPLRIFNVVGYKSAPVGDTVRGI
jgi:adenylate cyclase